MDLLRGGYFKTRENDDIGVGQNFPYDFCISHAAVICQTHDLNQIQLDICPAVPRHMSLSIHAMVLTAIVSRYSDED